jgi:TolA-binding protein
MNVRKSLVSLAVIGGLTVGFIGVAAAQTAPTPAPPTADHQFNCDHAHDVLAKFHARIDAVKDRIAKAEARVDQLRKEGHNQQADVLAKRIEKARDRLAKIEARLAKFVARVDQHCGTNPAPTAGSTASSSGSSQA